MEEKYRHLVTDGYNFNMSQYISEGWELFKKGAGSLIGFVLVYFIIYFVIAFIPFVNLLAGFVAQALIAGIFIFLRQQQRQKEEFGDFFGGFKYFGNIVAYVLLLLLIMLPIYALLFGALIPFELITEFANPNPSEIEYLMEDLAVSFAARVPIVLLVIALFVYVGVSYSLALPLIVDDNLGPWKAMETSRRIVSKRFFPFLGLYFVVGFVGILATMLTCGLGMLLVFPVVYCIVFAAYDSILQPHANDVTNQIDEFGEGDNDANTEAEENQ